MVQQDYHAIKKLSDLSISIRRWIFRSGHSFFDTFFYIQRSSSLFYISANKKSRNAKISHQQNPALSDAVLFFLHVLETDTYIHFDFKRSLYSHFQQLLQVPGKALLIDDNNFAAKANPSRTYPPCNIDTSNLFDEDGNPIFVAQSSISYASCRSKVFQKNQHWGKNFHWIEEETWDS